MRTTITLDADTEALIRKRMAERGLSFKETINEAIRESLSPSRRPRRFKTATARLGLPTVPLDRALQLAADIEDEEGLRKMRSGK